ncbi:hypothetical protein FKP32DRAFT_1603141 [Trametes sanguinea]|nr:hypothetical protein FKP32DRAFT_1603141 [Trametes sanguinea]
MGGQDSPYVRTPDPPSSVGGWDVTPTPQPSIGATRDRMRRLRSEAQFGPPFPFRLNEGESLDTLSLSDASQPATPMADNPNPFAGLGYGVAPMQRAQGQNENLPGASVASGEGATTSLAQMEHREDRGRKRARIDSYPQSQPEGSGGAASTAVRAQAASTRTTLGGMSSGESSNAHSEAPPPYPTTSQVFNADAFLQNPAAYPQYHSLFREFVESKRNAEAAGVRSLAGGPMQTPAANAVQPREQEWANEQPAPQYIHPYDMHLNMMEQRKGPELLPASGVAGGAQVPVPHVAQPLGGKLQAPRAVHPPPAWLKNMVGQAQPVQPPMDTRQWTDETLARPNPWLLILTEEEKQAALHGILPTEPWISRDEEEEDEGDGTASGIHGGSAAMWPGSSGTGATYPNAAAASGPYAPAVQHQHQQMSNVFFLPPQTPTATQQPMLVAGGSMSTAQFVTYSRPRFLAETGIMKLTLRPKEGFPKKHTRGPYDMTRHYSPATYARWEREPEDRRFAIEIYGYLNFADLAEVRKALADLKEAITVITGENTVIFYIPDNFVANEDSEVRDDPSTILAYHLSPEATKLLVKYRVWSLRGTDLTFFAYKGVREVPEYLIGFGGLTEKNEAATREEVRSFFQLPQVWQHLVQVLHHDGVPLVLQQAVARKIIVSLQIKLVPSSAFVSYAPNFSANVYSAPPPTLSPDRWQEWQTRLYQTAFALQNNPAAYIRGPERCEGCHGADHTTPGCPFPSIPQWGGKLKTYLTSATGGAGIGRGQPLGRGQRGGRGGGGGGRGRGAAAVMNMPMYAGLSRPTRPGRWHRGA